MTITITMKHHHISREDEFVLNCQHNMECNARLPVWMIQWDWIRAISFEVDVHQTNKNEQFWLLVVWNARKLCWNVIGLNWQNRCMQVGVFIYTRAQTSFISLIKIVLLHWRSVAFQFQQNCNHAQTNSK